MLSSYIPSFITGAWTYLRPQTLADSPEPSTTHVGADEPPTTPIAAGETVTAHEEITQVAQIAIKSHDSPVAYESNHRVTSRFHLPEELPEETQEEWKIVTNELGAFSIPHPTPANIEKCNKEIIKALKMFQAAHNRNDRNERGELFRLITFIRDHNDNEPLYITGATNATKGPYFRVITTFLGMLNCTIGNARSIEWKRSTRQIETPDFVFAQVYLGRGES